MPFGEPWRLRNLKSTRFLVVEGFRFYVVDEGQRNKYLGWQTERDAKSRLLSGLCEDVDIHLIARFAA